VKAAVNVGDFRWNYPVSPWKCINALLNHIPVEPGLLATLPSLSASVLRCFSDRWYIHRRCPSGISVSASSFSVLQWRWVISASVTPVSVLSVFQCFGGAGINSAPVTSVSVMSVLSKPTPHIPILPLWFMGLASDVERKIILWLYNRRLDIINISKCFRLSYFWECGYF
jgi:hypothetical protein